MATPARRAWIEHPLAQRLLGFNLAPLESAHPARAGDWPAQAQALGLDASALLRHAGAELLANHDPALALEFSEPALPIALCEPPLFEHLSLCCGLLSLGPAVRRAITRAEVAALSEQLGVEGLHFARRGALRLQAAGMPAPELQPDAREQALGLGAALIDRALDAAAPALAWRVRLRLPPLPEDSAPEALPEPHEALALTRAVLDELEPEWLSSFPAPH